MMLSTAEKRQTNRKVLWDILHNGRGRAGSAFRLSLILLILISSALVPIEFLIKSSSSNDAVAIIEAVVVGLFTTEYALRLYSAPNRLQYAFSFFGIVDLLSILPFYTGIFGSPFIRLIRLVRLFKLGEVEAAAEVADVKDMAKGIGLAEGEKVEYVVTKSPVALLLGIITPLFAFIFGIGSLILGSGVVAVAAGVGIIVFALIFLWKAWLDFSYDVIYVTNYRLIFQDQHIFGRSVNQVGYNAITNIKPYYPGAFSYILRYGSLIIETAAENAGQIHLNMLRRHEKAAHFIMQKTVTAQNRTGVVSVSATGGN